LREAKLLLHLILNAYWEPLDFQLPRGHSEGQNPWRRWIDTALDSPHDIVDWQTAPSVPGYTYRAEAQSVAVFFTELS
jgi:glycogen operon protein